MTINNVKCGECGYHGNMDIEAISFHENRINLLIICKQCQKKYVLDAEVQYNDIHIYEAVEKRES